MTAPMAKMGSEMDFDAIPELIGLEDDMKRALHILNNSRVGIYFTGYSGTGKTVFAQNLAMRYVEGLRRHGRPDAKGYYVQGTFETTKTSLIAGHRLIQGSMVPVKALVAQALEEGSIVFVDEFGHLMQEVMLTFNSLLDRWSVTSIGDIAIVGHEDFRIIFAGNPTTHAGNTPLPQSFASRLYAWPFDYPSFSQEDRIVRSIVEATYKKKDKVPNAVRRYVVGLYKEHRTPLYPLVARNMATAVVALNAEVRLAKGGYNFSIEDEAVVRNICKLSRVPDSKLGETAKEFSAFLSLVGPQAFKRIIEGAALVSLDVEAGQDIGARDRLKAAILTNTAIKVKPEADADVDV